MRGLHDRASAQTRLGSNRQRLDRCLSQRKACCLCATGPNKGTAAVRFVSRITFSRDFVRKSITEERMARRSVVAIAERSPKDWTPGAGIADKPVSDACFNDWKRFCFALREIASGDNGRPLSGLEAQKRAQAVLTECGYTWPGRVQVCEPIVAPTAAAIPCRNQAERRSAITSKAPAQRSAPK